MTITAFIGVVYYWCWPLDTWNHWVRAFWSGWICLDRSHNKSFSPRKKKCWSCSL